MKLQFAYGSTVEANSITLGETVLLPVDKPADAPDIKWDIIEALNKAGFVVMKMEIKKQASAL